MPVATNTLLGLVALGSTVNAIPWHMRSLNNFNTTAGATKVDTTVTRNSTFSKFALAADGTYGLVDTFDSANFFSDFSFYTGADPTEGDVNYYSEAEAESDEIISTAGGQVYLGVDWTTVNPPDGRPSVRLTSNTAYTHGLFIADLAHMPASICGVWPAWWLFGPDWPNNGEIDIIEGVNLNTEDTITLHTKSGCTVNIADSQSGTTLASTNCNDDNADDGCSASTTAAYGTAFNNAGGGVYAMQWESSGIYVWYWPAASIPSDITSGSPAPADWGTPVVAFNGNDGCVIDDFFADNNIVFDTTFCGTWAGAVWSDSSCASLASTCDDYVNENPGAFEEAYWLINSVKVYQLT